MTAIETAVNALSDAREARGRRSRTRALQRLLRVRERLERELAVKPHRPPANWSESRAQAIRKLVDKATTELEQGEP